MLCYYYYYNNNYYNYYYYYNNNNNNVKTEAPTQQCQDSSGGLPSLSQTESVLDVTPKH